MYSGSPSVQWCSGSDDYVDVKLATSQSFSSQGKIILSVTAVRTSTCKYDYPSNNVKDGYQNKHTLANNTELSNIVQFKFLLWWSYRRRKILYDIAKPNKRQTTGPVWNFGDISL